MSHRLAAMLLVGICWGAGRLYAAGEDLLKNTIESPEACYPDHPMGVPIFPDLKGQELPELSMWYSSQIGIVPIFSLYDDGTVVFLSAFSESVTPSYVGRRTTSERTLISGPYSVAHVEPRALKAFWETISASRVYRFHGKSPWMISDAATIELIIQHGPEKLAMGTEIDLTESNAGVLLGSRGNVVVFDTAKSSGPGSKAAALASQPKEYQEYRKAWFFLKGEVRKLVPEDKSKAQEVGHLRFEIYAPPRPKSPENAAKK